MTDKRKYPAHIRPGDRIVFFGDSITEQQLYTNYVETYLVCRYPELDLTFFNAGWSGDTAAVALDRIDRDVLSLDPTLVTICLGMNDGGYRAMEESIRTTFITAMTGIIERLKRKNIRVVLLTPGFVDETVNLYLKSIDYNRGNLRVLADTVIGLATQFALPCFDIHALMTDVDRRGKKKDSAFCLAPDSVHPNPMGHLVMAHGLLTALGVPSRNELVEVDLDCGHITTSSGVGARLIDQTGDAKISIDTVLGGLPFFVDKAARGVLPFCPFQQTFNSCQVRFHGATRTRYFLRAQNFRLGWMSIKRLSKGVELLDVWETDMMEKLSRVHVYINEKNLVYHKLWRLHALFGEKGQQYDRTVHLGGRQVVETLERGRAAFVSSLSPSFPVSLDLPGAAPKGELVDNGDFILTWSLNGPVMSRTCSSPLGDEGKLTTTLPEKTSSWVPFDMPPDAMANCLVDRFGWLENCCVYALTVLTSPIDQNGNLLLGSDDGFIIWLNGELIDAQPDLTRPVTPDQNRMPIRLRKGRNILLVRINQIIGGWGFCVRFDSLAQPVIAMHLS